MPTRRLLLTCLLTSLLAACRPGTPTAPPTPDTADVPAASAGAPAALAPTPIDALADVQASMDKFLAARSFHAVMTVEGDSPMQNEMDFVAPDRYRMVMPVGTQVIIGDTMYMDMQGRQTRVPIPEGTISQWRDPLKIRESRGGLSAEFLGREAVGQAPARKYRVHHTQPEPGEFIYWVGVDDLPLQLRHAGQSQGRPYTMILVYSRFNDPTITIAPP